MKLLVLFLNLTFLAVSLGKLTGYEYQQPEEITLQQSLGYTPEQYTIGIGCQHQQQSYAPIRENYKKHFFIYSAPDEEYEDAYAAHKISSTLQKNLRVLFIRAPEQKGLEQAALQLAKHASDDKTAIYVLHKQTDLGDLANRLNAHREQHTHKPEVHFVKYRTPEDAAHAQQQIQAQYDALRGSSHTSNEGTAPVLDFSTKRQPSYGNAISVVPAYAGVSNSGNNFNGYYTQPVASSAGLAGIPVGGYNTGSIGGVNSFSSAGLASIPVSAYNTASIGGVNSFSSFNSVGYNTNAITTTNGGSYGGIGAIGGLNTIGYNANALDNAAISTSLNGYGEPRAVNSQQILAENGVSKLNERLNTGGKLTFPTEGATDNSYLAPKAVKRNVF